MAQFTETGEWVGVDVLEPADAVSAVGGETAPSNKQARALVRRTAHLRELLEQLGLSAQGGSSTFAGGAGRVLSHNLGHQNYHINVWPTENPQGELGEVWIVKGDDTATVYNSGSFTGGFTWGVTDYSS